jgi:hypothetical protein
MKELVVLGFASRQLAEEARSCSAEVDPEGALNLDGVALAYRHHDQPNRHQPPGDRDLQHHASTPHYPRLKLPAGPSRGPAGCPRLARDACH